MRVSLELKPRVITGETKMDVQLRATQNASWVMGSGYSAYRLQGREPGDFVLINFVKKRRKTAPKAPGVKTPRAVLHRGHWVAYVYQVPARLVKSARQNARTFQLVIG